MINNRRMGNILERIGLNITLLREQRGLTQEKLAALAGLHRAYIGQVERGEMIEQTCKEIGYRFRRRKITPVVTVLHMVMAAIWPEESFNACWQVLWDSFVSWFPQLSGQCPSRGRVAEARARLPLRLASQRPTINGRDIASFSPTAPVFP
ncbi:MAG: helix-turn-helix domain-containing protein [Planctomycetota bacterium]